MQSQSEAVIELLPLLVISLSALWVYWDASGHKIGKVPVKGGFFNKSAGTWGLVTLLFWVVVFPAYLIARHKLVAQARELPVDSPARRWKATAFALFPVAALAALLALGGVTLIGYAGIPSCEDPRTLELVSSILQGQIKTNAPNAPGGFDIRYTSVISDGFDDSAKRWTCRAQTRITPPTALTDLVLKRLTAARSNVVNMFARLVGQATGLPDPAPMKKGYYGVDISYRSMKELQGGQHLVEITAESGEASAFSAFMALAAEVTPRAGGEAQAAGQGATPAATPTEPEPTTGPREGQISLQVQSFEMCGEEALCVHVENGATLKTNAYALDETATKLIEVAAKAKGRVCFTGVSGGGTEYLFEGVKSGC